MKGREIRESFLSYFGARGHTKVRSSPLVPANDPTLLFTNAGMVQFKDVFTGSEKRAYKRATSAQKCVRAGGKHNDLENVGFTARHHTFFEMLGNFSFGDYFKEEAIGFAWEWVTKYLHLPVEKLVVTVFEGEKNIPPDEEAVSFWRKQGVPPEKILRFGSKDNFWSMGDTGPCGPCSEIHYFQGGDVPCAMEARGEKCLGVGCDCDRWIEIWNLVFMQFERKSDGSLIALPKPSIDTGAGLERITAIMQGKRNNFDTDLFSGLITEGARIAGIKYGSTPASDVSLRVMADHARATAFLIADGVIPSNEGRGYVLRRIMRRAIRHGYRLGIKEQFLHNLCGVLIKEMSSDYPELEQSSELIRKVSLAEEEGFRQTLKEGLRLLDEEFDRMMKSGEKVVAGEAVFKLHDTFGFPTDLTGSIAFERGYSVDMAAFERLMEQQRKRAEWKGSGEIETDRDKLSLIKTSANPTGFVGYEKERIDDGIINFICISGKGGQTTAGKDEKVEIVTNKTPFYAESGGQAGDRGCIINESTGAKVRIENTYKVGGYFFHVGQVENGAIASHKADEKTNDVVSLQVDHQRRSGIKSAHTATHLLHAALRKVLGGHVRQAGSLVDDEYLRFDFHHFSPVTQEQIIEVEKEVNGRVRANIERRYHVDIPIEKATKMGAMALFGEKYGDLVRMVEVGDSRELCGGTHVERTGDIGLFKIKGEGSVAAGVRRIEAFTGSKAEAHVRLLETVLRSASQRLRCSMNEVDRKIEVQLEKVRELEKKINGLQDKVSSSESKKASDGARTVAGVKAIAVAIQNADPSMLRSHADKLKEQIGSGVVLVGTIRDDKASFVCVVTGDLVKIFNAGSIVKGISSIVGGKGGGRPDMAQAGGPDVAKFDEAMESFYSIMEKQKV